MPAKKAAKKAAKKKKRVEKRVKKSAKKNVKKRAAKSTPKAAPELTHLAKNGEARMVDVSTKEATERVAIADATDNIIFEITYGTAAP